LVDVLADVTCAVQIDDEPTKVEDEDEVFAILLIHIGYEDSWILYARALVTERRGHWA
jgi:hypothetical protein